jgi:hypothetical protein
MQGRFAGPSGIAWQGLDSLSAGLHEYGERVERARQRAFDELAEEMEAWAKENAPWDDDTTDARQGLHAHAIHSGPRSVVWIAHSADVKYGIWLEIMQNGRFAILLPTVLHFAPQVGGKVAGRV